MIVLSPPLHLALQNQNLSPVTSFLGVSPPVRSGWQGGATNPLAHIARDKTWAQGSSSNLQVGHSQQWIGLGVKAEGEDRTFEIS